ncbi:hypothetical protein BSKO_09028 [Bryopsis sp. KO-2023]|nr:hypothetical protein BSKO_09028 [Bryopsis sp. KO-2023]
MFRFSVCRPAFRLGKFFQKSRGLVTFRKEKIGDRNWMASGRENAPLFSPASERNKAPILEVLRQNIDFSKFSGKGAEKSLTPLFFLEISGGSGQHLAHFSHGLRSECSIIWQPSDSHTDGFSSMRHYVKKSQEMVFSERGGGGDGNACDSIVLEPVVIDVTEQRWVVEPENLGYWGKSPPRCILYSEDLRGGLEERVKMGLEGNEGKLFDVVYNANMVHINAFDCSEGIFAGVGKILRKGGQFFMYGPFNVNGKYTSEGNANFDRQLRGTNPEWGIRDIETMEELALKNGLEISKRVQMPANNLMLIFIKKL